VSHDLRNIDNVVVIAFICQQVVVVSGLNLHIFIRVVHSMLCSHRQSTQCRMFSVDLIRSTKWSRETEYTYIPVGDPADRVGAGAGSMCQSRLTPYEPTVFARNIICSTHWRCSGVPLVQFKLHAGNMCYIRSKRTLVVDALFGIFVRHRMTTANNPPCICSMHVQRIVTAL
jgi:hypothetical protein